MSKALKDQAAFLVDNPEPYEACVVLDHVENGLHRILFQGDMETAERVMTAWNLCLHIDTKNITRRMGRFQ